MTSASNKDFDYSIKGELGAFGGGMGLRVLYLQSALPAKSIEQIALAEELPGSELWPVRDLFQRDVDYERVERGIVPWLSDRDKVKFFSPITLALLPFDSSTARLESEIPAITTNAETRQLHGGSLFRLTGDTLPHSLEGRAELTWNSKRCHLVALDGQHRVAALRSVMQKGGPAAVSTLQWSIPAVVMCVVREEAAQRRTSVTYLDVARSVFVYINTQARTPSRSRQILLNDESPAAIIAQEFVQLSHQSNGEVTEHLPMSVISWRDGTESVLGEGHKLLAITEVHDLVEEILLGEERGGRRAGAPRLLCEGAQSEVRLAELLSARALNAPEAREFRELAATQLVPALSKLFAGVSPIQGHIKKIRVIESRLASDGTAGNAALNAIRIGGAGNWRTKPDIAQRVMAAVRDMELSAKVIPELLRQDIGMRGIVSGFSQLLPLLREAEETTMPLAEHVGTYIEAVNQRLREGWLIGTSEQMNRHLRHITKNESGGVRNYRFDDIGDALGALCSAISAAAVFRRNSPRLRLFLKEVLRKQLYETVRQGYVGELKRQYRQQNSGLSAGEIRDRAQEKSRPLAGRHIDRILEDLDLEPSDA